MEEAKNEVAGNPYQRTAEWFEDRVGCLTASRMKDVLAVLKSGKPAAAYTALLDTIVAERLTGEAIGSFVNSAMQWGIDHEAEALAAYENETAEFVEQVGFIRHPKIEWLGASPDGLVGEDGLIEIKCPSSSTHIKYVLAGEVPEQYKPQMMLQMLCTGRKWCDFVSYDPRISEAKGKLFVVRFEPKPEELAEIEAKAVAFLSEVQKVVDAFRGKVGE